MINMINKKISLTMLSVLIILPSLMLVKPNQVLAADKADKLAYQLSGRIVIQVQEHGEAWYINPIDHKRYYLGRPHDAFAIMRHFGLGITNENLNYIPIGLEITYSGVDSDKDGLSDDFEKSQGTNLSKIDTDGDGYNDKDEIKSGYSPLNPKAEKLIYNKALQKRLSGYILLQVQSKGEAWYVDPISLKRVYLGRPDDAFAIMRKFGLGITNADLARIPKGENLIGWISFKQNNNNNVNSINYGESVITVKNSTLPVYTSGGSSGNSNNGVIGDGVLNLSKNNSLINNTNDSSSYTGSKTSNEVSGNESLILPQNNDNEVIGDGVLSLTNNPKVILPKYDENRVIQTDNVSRRVNPSATVSNNRVSDSDNDNKLFTFPQNNSVISDGIVTTPATPDSITNILPVYSEKIELPVLQIDTSQTVSNVREAFPIKILPSFEVNRFEKNVRLVQDANLTSISYNDVIGDSVIEDKMLVKTILPAYDENRDIRVVPTVQRSVTSTNSVSRIFKK